MTSSRALIACISKVTRIFAGACKCFASNITYKIIAAICIAPVTLANAGILNGKKATVFPSGKNDLIRNGAKYTGDSVTVDGNIITANGPMAAEAFGKKIVEMLK